MSEELKENMKMITLNITHTFPLSSNIFSTAKFYVNIFFTFFKM